MYQRKRTGRHPSSACTKGRGLAGTLPVHVPADHAWEFDVMALAYGMFVLHRCWCWPYLQSSLQTLGDRELI
jgi:hypothetical protein